MRFQGGSADGSQRKVYWRTRTTFRLILVPEGRQSLIHVPEAIVDAFANPRNVPWRGNSMPCPAARLRQRERSLRPLSEPCPSLSAR